MPSDLSIVIADAVRLPGIRTGLHLPGRVLFFTATGLASAMESIRAHQPKLVAVDALFARTAPGAAFVDRVEKLAIEGDIRFIVQLEGRWVTAPRHAGPGVVNVPGPAAVAVPSAPLVVAAPSPVVVPAQMAALSTRRAPRFLVRDPLNAVVENGAASLVDISVLGAQVVSRPVLRPNQKIKIALPDTGDMLHVMAYVAWSTFERPKAVADAHYRAGIEFTDAAQQALEDYRLRHCAGEPIPYRGR
jgi:hypothetical protein